MTVLVLCLPPALPTLHQQVELGFRPPLRSPTRVECGTVLRFCGTAECRDDDQLWLGHNQSHDCHVVLVVDIDFV